MDEAGPSRRAAFSNKGKTWFMEWIGLSLGLIGVAIGIVPLALDKEVPQQLIGPLWYLAVAFLIAGLAAGLEPLRKPIVLGCRLRFGRYPFLFVYLFADMFVERQRCGYIQRVSTFCPARKLYVRALV